MVVLRGVRSSGDLVDEAGVEGLSVVGFGLDPYDVHLAFEGGVCGNADRSRGVWLIAS